MKMNGHVVSLLTLCTQSLDQAQVSPRNCFFVTCSMKILGGAHFTDLINSY